MTKEEFIQREMSIWGEDYIFAQMDRGAVPVELEIDMGNGPKLRWWWIMPTQVKDLTNDDLTQANICATLPASPSVVSPVSTDTLTMTD